MFSRCLRRSFFTISLFALGATLTPAQTAGPVDTSKLPRLEGGTEASKPSARLTAYDLPLPAVQARASDALEMLQKDGWLIYTHPNTPTTTSADLVITTLKKGPHAIRVVVGLATREALATRITYEERPLAHDLPFPKRGVDIKYNSEKPQLFADIPVGVESPSLDSLTSEMITIGWELSQERTRSNNPIFLRPGDTEVFLSIVRLNNGRTRINIWPVEGHHRKGWEQTSRRNSADDMKELLGIAQGLMGEPGRTSPARPQRTASAPQPVENEQPLKAMSSSFGVPIAIPDTANNIKYDGSTGSLEFRTSSSKDALAAFHRADMRRRGWQEERSVINNENMATLNFKKVQERIFFTLMVSGDGWNVRAHGRGMVTAVPEKPQPAARPAPTFAAPSGPSAEQVGGDKLTVSDQRGLIVPAPNSSSGSERTPYRHIASARVAASITDLVAFYRRELASLNWKESADGSEISAERALVKFTAPDGPSTLVLTRNAASGMTDVQLTVRKDALAKEHGVAPATGMGKIVFGNPEDDTAVFTVNGKTMRVGPGIGGKEPNGPKIELPPGTYKVTVKLGRAPAKTEMVTLEADTAWGVIAGPRGALALPLY